MTKPGIKKKVNFYNPVVGSFFILKQIGPVLTLVKQLAVCCMKDYLLFDIMYTKRWYWFLK